MSTHDRTPLSQRSPEISLRQLETYRRAACRPDVRLQVDRLLDDLGRLGLPRGDGDPPLPAGAAVALAQATLELAITTAANDDDRALKGNALRGTILTALEAIAYGHINALVEAALACDIDAPTVVHGSYARH